MTIRRVNYWSYDKREETETFIDEDWLETVDMIDWLDGESILYFNQRSDGKNNKRYSRNNSANMNGYCMNRYMKMSIWSNNFLTFYLNYMLMTVDICIVLMNCGVNEKIIFYNQNNMDSKIVKIITDKIYKEIDILGEKKSELKWKMMDIDDEVSRKYKQIDIFYDLENSNDN